MRKRAIKSVLFSLIGLGSLPAVAQQTVQNQDLIFIEELPTEIRAQVHQKVVEYLRQNPHLISEFSTVALDSKGTIYVVDKKMAAMADSGSPSCMAASFTIENFRQEK